MSVRFHRLRVAEVQRLCSDAVAVTFDVPDELSPQYAFRPGQSLTVRRAPPGPDAAGGDERRSYSICAPAGARPRIGVREVPGGRISPWLVREVRPGDEIEVAPPGGTFTPDGTAGHHVLIAAGSGITPVLSIAATVLRDPAARVTLFYGNRRADTTMFADELSALKNAHPDRVELVYLLSREPREAELLTGRLDAGKLRALLRHLVPVAHVGQWWLCGPFGLVEGARQVLAEYGVPPGRIHQELFYVDEPPPEPVRAAPPAADGPSSAVTVVLDGRSTEQSLPRASTILEGAQRVRPDLPFACKGGVCGTCRARVTTGEVRMRRNFALDPGEIAAGYVLTCQSVPVTDAVTVDYDA